MNDFTQLLSFYPNLQKLEIESIKEYVDRLSDAKNQYDMSWKNISDIIYQVTGEFYSDEYLRKRYSYVKNKIKTENTIKLAEQCECPNDNYSNILDEIKKERYKLSDELRQNNEFVRRISREDTLLEIAANATEQLKNAIPLKYNSDYETSELKFEGQEMIIMLSDWHYGIEVDSSFNTFNENVCKERIAKFLNKCINVAKFHPIQKIRVVNLGDLIAGRIHTTIRLKSRIDTITQTMAVSELISEFIAELINNLHIPVDFYNCTDNHSRLEPDKSKSLDLESLARIIPWYASLRLQEFTKAGLLDIHSNDYGEDIIAFECLGYTIAGVHGDKDNQSNVISNISLLTHKNYDLILTAHNHHFACNEDNEIALVSNGTLMGSDDYSVKLRKTSIPSQNIVIVSKENVIEDIKRVPLK